LSNAHRPPLRARASRRKDNAPARSSQTNGLGSKSGRYWRNTCSLLEKWLIPSQLIGPIRRISMRFGKNPNEPETGVGHIAFENTHNRPRGSGRLLVSAIDYSCLSAGRYSINRSASLRGPNARPLRQTKEAGGYLMAPAHGGHPRRCSRPVRCLGSCRPAKDEGGPANLRKPARCWDLPMRPDQSRPTCLRLTRNGDRAN
jgi:hypothetical protein